MVESQRLQRAENFSTKRVDVLGEEGGGCLPLGLCSKLNASRTRFTGTALHKMGLCSRPIPPSVSAGVFLRSDLEASATARNSPLAKSSTI